MREFPSRIIWITISINFTKHENKFHNNTLNSIQELTDTIINKFKGVLWFDITGNKFEEIMNSLEEYRLCVCISVFLTHFDRYN